MKLSRYDHSCTYDFASPQLLPEQRSPDVLFLHRSRIARKVDYLPISIVKMRA